MSPAWKQVKSENQAQHNNIGPEGTRARASFVTVILGMVEIVQLPSSVEQLCAHMFRPCSRIRTNERLLNIKEALPLTQHMSAE